MFRHLISIPVPGILTAMLLTLLATAAVRADHEPDHRYEVEGYLLDGERQPLADVGISISSGNQILGSTRSDADGYYYLKLHLHDSSIGRKLRLATADFSGTITMTATAGDKTTRRLHLANFIGGKLVEGEIAGVGTARWIYYAGAAAGLIVVAGAAAARLRRRRKRRRRQAAAADGHRHKSRHRQRRRKR